METGLKITPEDFAEIQIRVDQKLIKETHHPVLPLTIFNYSTKTQYERLWDKYTTNCRGLIIDSELNVIARPFSKIFNYGEPVKDIADEWSLHDAPIRFYEKLDGVLGILYPDHNKPAIATRGSFTNGPSKFATEWIQEYSLSDFRPGYTYQFEILHPDSRIVINYEYVGLILIAVISNDGTHELDHVLEAIRLGMKFARPYEFSNIPSVITFLNKVDGKTFEGFVIKSADNRRIKIKAEEYLKLHKLIFNTSNKEVWLALKEHRLEAIYEILPDEMYKWVQEIEKDLTTKFIDIMNLANNTAMEAIKKFDTKEEIARYVITFPNKSVIFNIVNGKKAKAEAKTWDTIKPEYAKFSDEN